MFRKSATLLLAAFVLAVMTTPSFGQAVTSTSTKISFNDQTHTTGPGPAGVTSGDFNNDGKPDLAVIDGQANHVTLLLGSGVGQFTLGSDTNTGTGPLQIVKGIFTLTGKQDLAVANADKTITILLGRGDGTFLTGTIGVHGVPSALIAANLLNDGLTQLVDVECAIANTAPCSLNVYQSDARALFLLAQTIPLTGAPFANGLIVSDDFNLDGKPDIAVASGKQVMVFTNASSFNGTGLATLKLHAVIAPPSTAAIDGLTVGHFNAGAAPDLAIESFTNLNDPNFPNTDRIYLNTGTGAFFLKSQVPGTRGFGHRLRAADINGDGIEDLLIAGSTIKDGSLVYALGRGDGTFTSPVQVSNDGPFTGLIVRDLNLDSRHDLAFSATNPPAGFAATEVLTNQNAATNCDPPGSGSLAVNICSAITAVKSLTVKASGNSPNGVKRLELWIDGSKFTQAFSDQLNAKVAIAAGTHHVTVVGVDLYDSLVKKNITVSIP